LIFWPMTKSYHSLYGWQGGVLIYWLLFTNYGSVYLRSMVIEDRAKLLAEVAGRALFYVLRFMVLIGLFGMPSNIGSWPGRSGFLGVGTSYFSILAFLEYKRYFPRSVHYIFYLLSDEFVRVPKRKTRYKKGRLQSHVIKYSRAHYWWLILGLGVILIGALTPFLYATIDLDEPLALKIALWLFCTPFYLFGIVFLLSGPWMMFKFFTASPAWLDVRKEELRDYHKLIAEGFVPSYTNEEDRVSIEPFIIGYRLTLPTREGEFTRVETIVKLPAKDHLVESRSSRGTQFQLECAMPGEAYVADITGTVCVWHLQVNIRDIKRKKNFVLTSVDKEQELINDWALAFTLPALN